ncbi:MAG: hypothetical protein JWN38_5 [Candidatus Saccharibacteria bacterium]|nr:hypothetical protein [Candidatus Saccharibacteria bacterium]
MDSAREQKLLENIGKQIAHTRRAHGLTQQQLAEKIDLSVVAIAYIETGKRWPRLKTLDRIARTLKVPMSDFFDGVDSPNKLRTTRYIVEPEQ